MLIPLPALYIYKGTVPQRIVDSVNEYLDELLETEDRESHAYNLVGQIMAGEQLTMDFNHEDVKEMSMCLLMACQDYLRHYFSVHPPGDTSPDALLEQVKMDISSMWSVHSYEGDYNPLHDHNALSPYSLSCIVYLKVPESVTGFDDGKTATGAGGATDGMLNFVYGQSPSDFRRLVPPHCRGIVPKVGDVYVFPNWLEHEVWPFTGEEERRSMSANVNTWYFPRTMEVEGQKVVGINPHIANIFKPDEEER